MRIIVTGLMALCLTQPASGQPGRPAAATSVYTPLVIERCRLIDSHPDEAGSARWRCPGYRGIPLYAANGDDRFFLDAGAPSEMSVSSSAFSAAAGNRVEWRVRGGRPFALIHGLSVGGSDVGMRRVLAVKTIGGRGRVSCLVAWVDGTLPDANARARAEADSRAATFRCGRDRPRLIGQPYGVSID